MHHMVPQRNCKGETSPHQNVYIKNVSSLGCRIIYCCIVREHKIQLSNFNSDCCRIIYYILLKLLFLKKNVSVASKS